MGLQDRDYMRKRPLKFPELHRRRWWMTWQSWLPMAAAVIAVLGAAVWVVRDARDLVGGSGPEPGSLLVNINTAPTDELETVPGIGPTRAAQIIAGRPWTTVDDLVRIPGIGPAQVDGMRPFLRTSGKAEERR